MQEVTIELGGKQRRLALDLNADIALQEQCGETLGELLASMQAGDGGDPKVRNLARTKAVRSLLWAAVQADGPATIMEVGSWVTAGNLVPVMEALGKAVRSMAGGDEFEGQLAPFVPTPEPVVQAMIRMAKITDDSVVIDMGAGDGRLLFAAHAAAERVLALGYEVHQGRFDALREKIALRNLGGWVAAKYCAIQDALDKEPMRHEIQRADVVFLYLLDSSNLLIRDRLRAAMKPGARLISHDFRMGDWEPEASETVMAERLHKVYRWVI